jgi:hypothetical protein
MPTSLPLLYLTDVIASDKSLHAPDAVWLIAIWGIVMLTFGALANFGMEIGAMDPLQPLAQF